MSAKVSVILPSLNVAAYIEECMDSVIHQSLSELEIICVDAGSTDGTKEILTDYAKRDSRVIVLHSGIKSYGQQVNMGLEYAGGEYIAVLETDDWIVPDMYQCLYEHAVADQLDYAAADFDTFYELQSGYYYFFRQRVFSARKQDLYGEILDSEQIATLRASDYVLWRGIYNRKFLIDHRIRLHESSGAAFQDMGFLQQVKTYAKKAKYIDKSFYRYRQGRGMASSGSMEGLRYYEEEFRWLNGRQKFIRDLKGNHKKYYYFTMSISFITKYEQILFYLNGNWQDVRLSNSYEWFKKQIMDAIRDGFLEETMYDKKIWESMNLLLVSQKLHAEQFINKNREKEKPVQLLLQEMRNRPIVIFGCGKRGEQMMFFCDRNHICVTSFCDNNVELHGKNRFGFPIISPEALKDAIYDKDEMILLSMKKGTEQVYEQLVSLGIGTDRIIKEIPEGIM